MWGCGGERERSPVYYQIQVVRHVRHRCDAGEEVWCVGEAEYRQRSVK